MSARLVLVPGGRSLRRSAAERVLARLSRVRRRLLRLRVVKRKAS